MRFVTGGSRWTEIMSRKYKKVNHHLRVREKTELKISPTNDHKDTEKETHRRFLWFKNRSFFCRCQTRREQDGYVTLNAWKSRLNVFPALWVKSGFGSWNTYSHRDVFAKYGKIPSPASQVCSPEWSRNVTRAALGSKSL